MDEPYSRLRASLFGQDWLGYGQQRQALDDLYNASVTHMQVTGHAKRIRTDGFKKPPAPPAARPRRLADVPMVALARQINT